MSLIKLASSGSSQTQQGQDRRREDRGRREDEQRRRASAQPNGAGVPGMPSAALQRSNSKTRKIPNALVPGGGAMGTATPNSAAAHIGVPAASPGAVANTPTRRVSGQNSGHPYASATGEYGAGEEDPYASGGAGYGRAPGMPSGTAAAPELTPARARGMSADAAGGEGAYDEDLPKPSLLMRILTCRCG